MTAGEENKNAAPTDGGGTDEHGEDEYLSRKALQRYMHTTKVMQEQGKKPEDGNKTPEKDKTEGAGGSSVSGNVTGKDSGKQSGNAEHDFENILRLDGSGDAGADADGDDKLLSKLVDDSKRKRRRDEDGDVDGDRNDVEVLEDDDEDEDDDDLVASTGNGLLESLTTDIEKYHKKVQLKKKFDNSALVMEKKISHELGKAAEAEAEADAEEDEEELGKKRTRNTGTGTGSDSKEQIDLEDEDSENAYKRSKTSLAGRKVSSWTKAEDDAIVYYKEEMKYSWKKIEELLEKKHSWQAIQMRYLRNHKSRNDEWSRYMEIKLINAIRKDWENRWKRISADLGRDFGTERCTTKNIEICKKMELPYYNNVFKNKEVTVGYKNQFNDIKDAEAHKKLMLVYMGLDSITYEDSDNEDKGLTSHESGVGEAGNATANTETDSNAHAKTAGSGDIATTSAANGQDDAGKTDIHMNMNMNMGMMGMNMGMNIDEDENDVHVADIDTANVDPAITGESIPKHDA
ncbi:hypothetical protein PMKS-003859 [Pichia membranifaciens]|uniref:Myb-like domain-containing protein n=1 Tax=Pichia membranifaciens TaxID=4926 RepID=A0A1Q2YLC3_9ASCO|nr:hypothetical protein PMKS-003859 [Pichia membranifaciens]